MPAKKGLKQLAVWMEEDEKESFKTLCDTVGVDVSTVIRKFVGNCIENQNIIISTAPEKELPIHKTEVYQTLVEKKKELHSKSDRDVLRSVFKRLDALERAMPQFEVEDLKRMKEEVLEGDFGSMRNRIGICEKELQHLGGSISWPTDSK